MNKKELELAGVKSKYGFLYHGYHSNRYYWEFVVMGRKLLIISVALFLRSSTVSMQLIFVILILIFALVLNHHYKPFELEELNNTENYSICLSITCFTSGLMVEAESAYSWHIVLFVVLVIANTLFFLNLAKRVYHALGHYLWTTWPILARTFWPRATRPAFKIKDILAKEKRRKSRMIKNDGEVSELAGNNREVVIQLCNMRNFVDFYDEVLVAKDNRGSRWDLAKKESERADREAPSSNEDVDNAVNVEESRPFFQRLFRKTVRRETVLEKIKNIKKKVVNEIKQHDDSGQGSRDD